MCKSRAEGGKRCTGDLRKGAREAAENLTRERTGSASAVARSESSAMSRAILHERRLAFRKTLAEERGQDTTDIDTDLDTLREAIREVEGRPVSIPKVPAVTLPLEAELGGSDPEYDAAMAADSALWRRYNEEMPALRAELGERQVAAQMAVQPEIDRLHAERDAAAGEVPALHRKLERLQRANPGNPKNWDEKTTAKYDEIARAAGDAQRRAEAADAAATKIAAEADASVDTSVVDAAAARFSAESKLLAENAAWKERARARAARDAIVVSPANAGVLQSSVPGWGYRDLAKLGAWGDAMVQERGIKIKDATGFTIREVRGGNTLSLVRKPSGWAVAGLTPDVANEPTKEPMFYTSTHLAL